MISLKYVVTGIFLLTAFSFDLHAQSGNKLTLSAIREKSYASFILPAFQSRDELVLARTSFREQKKNFRCSFLTLNNLAKAAESIDDTQAFDCLYNLLVWHENLQIRTDLFENMVAEADSAVLIRDPS